MWWVAENIERTVTREFVCSHLLPDEIARLDQPLGFGDGLTDGTYWEWIDEKAKRIFLILVDLRVPDQIFGVIDDSWDDDDLPIAREHVASLALTPNPDDRFDRKFYQRQFHYLLRPLERSDLAFVYDDTAVVPLDVVDNRRPSGGGGHHSSGSIGGSGGGGISLSTSGGSSGSGGSGSSTTSNSSGVDRVVLPNYPGMVFSRRRIPLAPMEGSAYGSGYITLEEFQYEVNSIRNIQNDHLVSYWASYVHQGVGYVLFTPASDGSVKSLLTTTPTSIKNLTKQDRRRLIFNWIHCLVDTLCFVHNRGLSHGNIKPSTVLLSYHDNSIFFSDFTYFSVDSAGGSGSAADKASFDKESYDYAAPEQWYRPSGSGGSSRKNTLTGERGGGSMYAGNGGGSSNYGGYGGGLSASPEYAAAAAYAYHTNTSSSFSISRTHSNTSDHHGGVSASAGLSAPIPQLNPQAADVFSLGCIILELLSFMLKRQTKAFATHRAAKHKSAGRGGAVLDSSFHKNLGQLESWMSGLAKDAAASLNKKRSKDDYDPTLAGVTPMLHVVERMLSLHASERPSAFDVQTRMYQILRDQCEITEPHCVHQYPGALAVSSSAGWSDDYYTVSHSAYGGYGGSYSSSAVQTTGTNTTSNSSRAVSPTAATAPGGRSWGSNYVGSPTGPSYMDSTGTNGRFHPKQQPRHHYQGRHHVRTDSGSGGSGEDTITSPVSPTGAGGNDAGGEADLTDGLQAIRNLQIRDKVRPSREPWNAPVYAV